MRRVTSIHQLACLVMAKHNPTGFAEYLRHGKPRPQTVRQYAEICARLLEANDAGLLAQFEEVPKWKRQ